MVAQLLHPLSFPERPTISPSQRGSRANGVSVKDVRARLPRRRGRPVGAWKRATQPSALIAMKTPSSWVYGVAGGTGALWEVLLSWPRFCLLPTLPEGHKRWAAKWTPDGRGITGMQSSRRREHLGWMHVPCCSVLHGHMSKIKSDTAANVTKV